MRITTHPVRLVLLVGILSLALSGGTAAAQEEAVAIVTVFHAVPAEDGFPADVYLDGQLIIDGFVFEASSDSFELPGGPVQLEIFPDGSDPETESPAVATEVTLETGINYSVVAQISGGAPVITLYENDTSGIEPGKARFTFRQTSSAPTLDVAVDGEAVFSGIASTNESTTELDAMAIQVTISGETSGEVFNAEIDLPDGMLTVVYAVGDPGSDDFDLLVQEVVLPQVSPTGVPSGSGGHKARSSSVPPWTWPLLPIAALGLIMAWRRRVE